MYFARSPCCWESPKHGTPPTLHTSHHLTLHTSCPMKNGPWSCQLCPHVSLGLQTAHGSPLWPPLPFPLASCRTRAPRGPAARARASSRRSPRRTSSRAPWRCSSSRASNDGTERRRRRRRGASFYERSVYERVYYPDAPFTALGVPQNHRVLRVQTPPYEGPTMSDPCIWSRSVWVDLGRDVMEAHVGASRRVLVTTWGFLG